MKIKIEELLKPEIFKKHEKELTDYFAKGGTWKLLFNINNHVLEEQYRIASQLYQEHKYEEAEAMFTYLSLIDPYVYEYWIGLASTKHALQHYEEAIVHYTTASAIDPKNPMPHLQLSNCFFAIREVDLAKEELEETKKLCDANSEYEGIKREVLMILQNFPKLR